ncbi:hypothetical protein GGR57DRAFT_502314 [Xylariaceae sp. FL1272]|nr:hypothetical protein GGR57DRAFT_502314 [Xylariaceae sp. FL1272]
MSEVPAHQEQLTDEIIGQNDLNCPTYVNHINPVSQTTKYVLPLVALRPCAAFLDQVVKKRDYELAPTRHHKVAQPNEDDSDPELVHTTKILALSIYMAQEDAMTAARPYVPNIQTMIQTTGKWQPLPHLPACPDIQTSALPVLTLRQAQLPRLTKRARESPHTISEAGYKKSRYLSSQASRYYSLFIRRQFTRKNIVRLNKTNTVAIFLIHCGIFATSIKRIAYTVHCLDGVDIYALLRPCPSDTVHNRSQSCQVSIKSLSSILSLPVPRRRARKSRRGPYHIALRSIRNVVRHDAQDSQGLAPGGLRITNTFDRDGWSDLEYPSIGNH